MVALFDYRLLFQRKERASKKWSSHSFLHQHIATDLVERLYDIKRTFDTILLYNDVEGVIERAIQPKVSPLSTLMSGHFHPALISSAQEKSAVVYDENFWPFKEEQFDLILTHLAHHWLNNPFHTFQVIRQSLKQEGFIAGSFFGDQTLFSLKEAILQTEMSLYGGHSPRVIPFMSMDKVSHVLNRIGYHDVVVDKTVYTVDYQTLGHLIEDLRGMGETNTLVQQNKRPLNKSFMDQLQKHYPSFLRDSYTATFEIIFFAGWR